MLTQSTRYIKNLTGIIQNRIARVKLRPAVQITHRRTEFGYSNSDNLHITIDTDIVAYRSDSFDKKKKWSTWLRDTSGQIADDEKSVFPMAMMEIRQRSDKTPQWLQQLIDSKLVETRDFTKFIHATAMLYPSVRIS